MASRIEGDHVFVGTVAFAKAGGLSLPTGAVTADNITADARVPTSKLMHRQHKTYAQESATAATDETRAMHVVYGATGALISFKAGCVTKAVGAATCTVDLLKNGVSVLSAAITLNSSNSNRVAVAATISSPSVVVGDLLEVVIDGTVGGGTLAKGIFADLIVDETAA